MILSKGNIVLSLNLSHGLVFLNLNISLLKNLLFSSLSRSHCHILFNFLNHNLHLCHLYLSPYTYSSILLFQSLSHVRLLDTQHGLQHARLPSPSTNSWSLLKLMSVESVMPSNHFILCHPLLFLPSVFPSIRESVLPRWWPKYWSFSFSISSSNEYSGLISFRIDWFDPFYYLSIFLLFFPSLSYKVFKRQELCLLI